MARRCPVAKPPGNGFKEPLPGSLTVRESALRPRRGTQRAEILACGGFVDKVCEGHLKLDAVNAAAERVIVVSVTQVVARRKNNLIVSPLEDERLNGWNGPVSAQVMHRVAERASVLGGFARQFAQAGAKYVAAPGIH